MTQDSSVSQNLQASSPQRPQPGTRNVGRGARILVATLLIVSALVTTLYVGLSLYIATQLVYVPQTPLYATPAKFGMQFRNVTFPSRVDQGLRLLGVGDVCLDRTCACLPGHLLRLVLARAIAERDVRSGTCELESDRTPDAPRTARDESGLPFQRREGVRQRGASPRACRPLLASRPRSSSRCGRFV